MLTSNSHGRGTITTVIMENLDQPSLFVVDGGLNRKAPPKSTAGKKGASRHGRGQRKGRKIESPLVWRDDMLRRIRLAVFSKLRQSRLSNEEREDLSSAVIEKIGTGIKRGHFENWSGVEAGILNSLNSEFRKINAKKRTAEITDLEPFEEVVADKSTHDSYLRDLANDYPLTACLKACEDAGISRKQIAKAFAWNQDRLFLVALVELHVVREAFSVLREDGVYS
jgi:hypothetical protein